MSDFRASLWAANADDAETQATAACDAYYGDRPYTMDVIATERRTFGGDVRGYEVDVWATEAP